MLRERSRASITIFIASWIILSGIIIIPLSLLDVEGQEVLGTANFTEDFYMTTYMDANESDVVGWGIGSIELAMKPKVTELSLVGSCDIQADARGIFVKGNYAYVCAGIDGFFIINITDPINPILTGNCDSINIAFNVKIKDDFAYVTDYGYGLRVINITTPKNPTLTGSAKTPGYAKGIYIVDDYLYISYEIDPVTGDSGEDGLGIIDISDPKNPTIIATFNTSTSANDVYVSGNYAYVAEGDELSGNFEIVNISDSINPTLAGSYDISENAWDMQVVENFAYIIGSWPGFLILNVTDPTNPTLQGSYNDISTARIFIDGNYAYVTGDYTIGLSHIKGLFVINITDPINPTLIGSCDTTQNYIHDIYVVDDYAYITDDSGLKIIEIWHSNENRYQSKCPAFSLEIDTTDKYIYHANLTCEDNIPPGTSIKYYLCAGGSSFEQVIPGTDYIFYSPGNNLQWLAILSTTNGSVTPSISKISISYEYDSSAPDSSAMPILPYWQNISKFRVGWNAIDNYNIVDITLFYRYSADNVTWSDWIEYKRNDTLWGASYSGEFTFAAPKGDGIYEFYTAANDISGNLESMPLVADAIAGVDTGWPGVNPPEAYGKYNNTGTINWSWVTAPDTGSGIVGYFVCVGTTLGGSDIVNDSFTTNNWYQISSLQNNNTYYCKIKAKNGARTIGNYRNGDFVTVDTKPPYSLSILINDGARETQSLIVNLTLNATDNISGINQMALSNDGINWSAWETFSLTKSYTLPLGNGPKTVYFKVKDYAGNIAPPVSDTIILNVTYPANDIDGDGILNHEDPDMDGDGIPNYEDPDIDGDGIPNEDDEDSNYPSELEHEEPSWLPIIIVLILYVIIILYVIANYIKRRYRTKK